MAVQVPIKSLGTLVLKAVTVHMALEVLGSLE
jgi:hypothetical protein